MTRNVRPLIQKQKGREGTKKERGERKEEEREGGKEETNFTNTVRGHFTNWDGFELHKRTRAREQAGVQTQPCFACQAVTIVYIIP